ncbi:hypothetical protein ACFWY9_29495 [Amycolatopsis sp. NPDC059027]|uniref:hypothetical protein n=1 Tax=unclassified Amycolatopsis TaxID=2618356 RepID=UPI00366F82D9
MSWNELHRRQRVVQAVLGEIAESGLPVIPAGRRAELDAEFGGFDGFLREVQFRWYRAFDARLDAVLEEDPADVHAALVRLWHELAAVMPAARLLLDACTGHPALAELDDHHRGRLYQATGVRLDPGRIPAAHQAPRHRRMPRWCPLFAARGAATA